MTNDETRSGVQTGGMELVPITEALRARLERLAAADGHGVIWPSHGVLRDGELVGYGSLGVVRMFYAWMDSKRTKGLESFRAWRAAEELMRAEGHQVVCMPCEKTSPFAPFLERKGYKVIGEGMIGIKPL